MFWVLIYLKIVLPKQDTNDTLHFKVHDMRVPFEENAILICLPVLVISKKEDNLNNS
jgi:hypothetical protein